MLLALFPFVATAALFWLICDEVFVRAQSGAPPNWTAKIFLPVLTGSLSSLAVVAVTKRDKDLLLSAVGAGVLFALLVAAGCRDEKAYFGLKLRVGVGSHRLRRVTWWKLVRISGLLITTYAAVVTTLAA